MLYGEKWLQNCPLYFKLVFYRRYVDDNFVLFRHFDHVQVFLNYLISQHSNSKFTNEKEVNNILPFLDVKIT